ncbi:MAG: DNA double-strand break repair nuclease NurA [Ardenticatenales bacterium]
MADFLDTLTAQIERERARLTAALTGEATPAANALADYVAAHWHPLPPTPDAPVAPASLSSPPGVLAWPAHAVDGSIAQADLDDGSYLFIVRALALGDGGQVVQRGGMEVLPPSTAASTASRYADLLQRHYELSVACEVAAATEPGGVVFLDGALYGWLPQMYSLPGGNGDADRDVDADGADDRRGDPPAGAHLPDAILAAYLELLTTARARGVRIVAVSKTSREAAHCRLWLDDDERSGRASTVAVPDELTDSAMIHRFTDDRAGVSTPVVLGTRAFVGGSRAILERPEVAGSPAIVSFFVRLAELDDALRIDVPAHQCGVNRTLADVGGREGGAVVAGGVEAVASTLELLRADYGGLAVYNALLYSVDREVRLSRNTVADVYLPVIEQMLGVRVRLDRGERRFAGSRG